LRDSDLERAKAISKEALSLARQYEFTQGVAYALRNLGRLQAYEGEFALSLANVLESNQILFQSEDKLNLAHNFCTLTQIYFQMGEYAQTLEYSLKFLDLAEAINDDALRSEAYNAIGAVRQKMNDYDPAIESIANGLIIARKNGDRRSQIMSLNNLAMVHIDGGNYSQALAFGNEAWEMAKADDLVVYQATIAETIAGIYRIIGNYKKAEYFGKISLQIAQKQNFKSDEIEALFTLAEIHKAEKDYEKSLIYLQKAKPLTELLDSERWRMTWHKQIGAIYEKIGDFEQALIHFKSYDRFKEIVFNEKNSLRIRVLQVVHQTETAHKEAELLRLKNKELEREIRERMRVEAELIKAKSVAEKANQAKSDFFSKMSHELRSPLSGILGFAEFLQEMPTLDQNRVLNAAQAIERSGKHLLNLINDILDTAKIEAGKLELALKPIVLAEMLANVISMLQMPAEKKGVELCLELSSHLPHLVITDEKRLSQVLINLLGNAIKFTENGWVVLKVCPVVDRVSTEMAEEESNIKFEVIDSGIGIKQENLKRIFRSFEQVGNQSTHANGTGLGLAISQKLVLQMGGRIKVKSEVGKGSHFWFTLSLPVIK
jgi:signal transduction histidine kinase